MKNTLLTFLLIASTQLLIAQKKVKIETSMGDIVVKLYDETPLHRDNFIKLAKEGFYDGLLFHRVIQNFMIQGGDPDSKGAPVGKMLGNGGPGYEIPAEIKPEFIHKKGALAAARLGDNMNPTRRSSGSQFYIVQGQKFPADVLKRFEQSRGKPYTEEEKKIYAEQGGTPHLDGSYTVFGEVVEGMEVVEKIAAVQKNQMDRPTQDVVIKKMTVLKK